MDRLDAEPMMTLSFIVRLWLEETADEAGQPVWRGHVTHVPTGQRRHFAAPEEIPEIIRPYMSEATS